MKGFSQILFLSVLFFVGAQSVSAASLYIDPSQSSLNRGDAIKLAVRLDVDEVVEECVNAVDGVITYSDNIEPVDISTGDSIFSVWLETPVINKEQRTITFAGGIPNGYCGRVPGDPRLTNNIVELIFRSPGFTVGSASSDKTGVVEFGPETTAYLNDGRGTTASLATYGAKLELADRAGSTILDPWTQEISEDTRSPQEFSISLQKDTRAFGGKYFIVFNTTDKETGIDHYEVMEEPLSELGSFKWGRADAPWVTTRSPYTLEDQTLNSVIRVKAIDKAGNEYIATLIPNEDERGIPSGYFILGGGLLLIILLLLGIGLTGYRAYKSRMANKPSKETVEPELPDEEVEQEYE